jgi:predicted nucleic-acid-binding protein
MIGLDTNVIVRYVVRDDPEQTAQADAVFQLLTARRPGFVATVVLAELWWVLGRHYRYDRGLLCDFVRQLLASDELRVQDVRAAQAALAAADGGADFADALIAQAGVIAGCELVVTFDRRAVRAGMRDVGVLLSSSPDQLEQS